MNCVFCFVGQRPFVSRPMPPQKSSLSIYKPASGWHREKEQEGKRRVVRSSRAGTKANDHGGMVKKNEILQVDMPDFPVFFELCYESTATKMR